MNEIPLHPRLAKHVRRQVDRATGNPILLHPEGATELSETADAIVTACDGSRVIDDVVAHLAEEYDAPDDVLRSDVVNCLRELAAAGFLAEGVS